MRVTEAKTGDVKVDSGVRSVEAGRRVGNGVIPVAGEMASDALSAGGIDWKYGHWIRRGRVRGGGQWSSG